MKVGVIGVGYWGPNLARNLCQLLRPEDVVVWDLAPAAVERLQRVLPGTEKADSLEGLLADDRVRGVVIATPAATHHEMARAALLAGKGVLVEKPLALSTEHAEELARLAEERGQVLMVGHTFLYNASVQYVRRLLQDAHLGTPYYVYSQRLNLGRYRSDCNVLWNLAPHDISIVNYWLEAVPDAITVQGAAYLNPEIEDVAFLQMRYPEGQLAHVHVSWLDPGRARQIVVVGSRRMVVYDDTSDEAPIRIYDKGLDLPEGYPDFGEFRINLRYGDVHIPHFPRSEPLKEECADFLHCLRTGEAPKANAQSGIEVVRVLEQTDALLAEQRKALGLRTAFGCPGTRAKPGTVAERWSRAAVGDNGSAVLPDSLSSAADSGSAAT